ncbi:MAG: bifunctional hydroxymethylpyrimidine kinase/phosphomethylpyrimidine kinase [Acidobacteria bacterium]|nr:bifunctional hydroxymethylpyrimidine kinase/phosphomethylpyrimidine kinase [Acidobacteriota bacterium]
MKRIPRALTVAGSDSGGGAGIQADLKTFAALGVHGMSAVTAVTAQNSVDVCGVFELPPKFIAEQINAVLADFGADAAKTGMLSNGPAIEAVAGCFESHHVRKFVLDPVMTSTSGRPLLRPEAIRDLITRLIPLALLVTPNLHEASLLANLCIPNRQAMEEAARVIHRMGCRYVLIKGGHLAGDRVTDVLYDGKQTEILTAHRVATENIHGTGCTLSAAITAGLAQGLEIPAAVRQAKEYVTGALQRSYRLGSGPGALGHFWKD